MTRLRVRPGVAVTTLFLLAAMIGPLFATHSPEAIELAHAFELPSARHWFGTSDNGVDIFSVLVSGARLSAIIAIGTVSISLLIGTAIGVFAGARGGRVDQLTTGGLDVMQAFPPIVLNVGMLAVVEHPGVVHMIAALAAHGWVVFARIARAETLALREREYVAAARALGVPERTIIWRHMLPNIAPPIAIQATAALGGAVVAEATLSFLGLGPGRAVSWGALLDQGTAVLLIHPHVALISGAAVAITVLGLNSMGDAVRDWLDPRVKT